MTGPATIGSSIVDKFDLEWKSIEELCSGLSEREWKLPTDCPAWTVQDHVSHMTGTEADLLGRPAPDHVPARTDHVRNPLGHANEVHVDFRRSRTGAEVLDEFRDVTRARLEVMRSSSDEDLSKEWETPIGPVNLEIRLFDCWVHEQDIRRAVEVRGHLDGPVAQVAFGRLAQAMPYVVGKKVAPPDGTTVVFDVRGAAGGTVVVGMEQRRGRLLERPPASPDVKLVMDLETFNCLGCGRWDAAKAMQEERVTIEGSDALGLGIVEQMNFMM